MSALSRGRAEIEPGLPRRAHHACMIESPMAARMRSMASAPTRHRSTWATTLSAGADPPFARHPELVEGSRPRGYANEIPRQARDDGAGGGRAWNEMRGPAGASFGQSGASTPAQVRLMGDPHHCCNRHRRPAGYGARATRICFATAISPWRQAMPSPDSQSPSIRFGNDRGKPVGGIRTRFFPPTHPPRPAMPGSVAR
jgi:hypothetical protein